MAKDKELPRGVPEERTPIPGGADTNPLPKHGTQRVADTNGPLPRVVNALDRAPNKGRAPFRFKARSNNYHPQKTRYILANDEASARDCFLKTNGLDKQLEKLKANGATPEPVDVVITQLED
jgi:hypothetical protein